MQKTKRPTNSEPPICCRQSFGAAANFVSSLLKTILALEAHGQLLDYSNGHLAHADCFQNAGVRLPRELRTRPEMTDDPMP
jgi:hypothetical protein